MTARPLHAPAALSDPSVGLAAALGANMIWGFVPLYYGPLLSHVSPWTTVAYRVLLSLPLLYVVVPWVTERRAARSAPLAANVACAALIAGNWLSFVYLVTTGRVIEASLAYFVSPLMMLACGVVVLGERLTRRQACACVLAAAGCCVFAAGSGLSTSLWPMAVAASMAGTMSAYVTLRRRYDVPSIAGLRREVVLLTPFALLWAAWVGQPSHEALWPGNNATWAILAGAGVLTVVPLVLFGYAARLLPLATIGFVHYSGPSLQLLCGWLLMGEAMSPLRWLGLGTIWVALGVYASARRTSSSV